MRVISFLLVFLLAAGGVAAAEPAAGLGARAALRKERAHRRAVRNAGLLLVGGGVALAAGTGLVAALGRRNNDSIRVGGYQTADDIEAKVEQGRTLNLAAWCMAGGAAVLAGTGFALVLANPDPRMPRLEATAVDGGAIIGVGGALP